MPNSELLTSTEAAEVLGVSVWTVSRWVRKGELKPATKLAGLRGAYVFHRDDVEAFRKSAA